MTLRLRLTRLRVALIAAVATLAAGGVAYAVIPDDARVFHACMLNGVGTIRLIDPSLPSANLISRCTSRETRIQWNQQGPPGLPGQPGADGAPGVDGRSVVWRGAWSADASYAEGDAVSHDGSSYIATTAVAAGGSPPPTADAAWDVMAAKGAAGAAGEQGAPGTTDVAWANVRVGTAPREGVVRATVVHSRGVASVQRVTVGIYDVTFERDVSNCAPIVSVGRLGMPASASAWAASSDPSYSDDPSAAYVVRVLVVDSTNRLSQAIDSAFSVFVAC